MAFSLVQSRVLVYAFIALVIACVIASIFAMSFGLFFTTVAVAIVVYAVYRIQLDGRQQEEEEERPVQLEPEQDLVEERDVYAFAPAVVQAPPARLVVQEEGEDQENGTKKRKRKVNAVRKPTPEEVEYARRLSKQQSKTFSRVTKRRQMQGLDDAQTRPGLVRTASQVAGRAPQVVDRKFLGSSRKQLHTRRKKPNRRPDSSGYAQLASFRWDHSKSLSENVAKRLMGAGANLPEPKHARRRLMTSMLRDYPLKLAPGMVRVPKGLDLKPCRWK